MVKFPHFVRDDKQGVGSLVLYGCYLAWVKFPHFVRDDKQGVGSLILYGDYLAGVMCRGGKGLMLTHKIYIAIPGRGKGPTRPGQKLKNHG